MDAEVEHSQDKAHPLYSLGVIGPFSAADASNVFRAVRQANMAGVRSSVSGTASQEPVPKIGENFVSRRRITCSCYDQAPGDDLVVSFPHNDVGRFAMQARLPLPRRTVTPVFYCIVQSAAGCPDTGC